MHARTISVSRFLSPDGWAVCTDEYDLYDQLTGRDYVQFAIERREATTTPRCFFSGSLSRRRPTGRAAASRSA
jgi:hypothetical protein